MKYICSLAITVSLLLSSCNNEPTLQKYFVENTDNKNFIALDLSPSILNIDTSKLTVEQNDALNSFDKMNILAFKLNDKNKAEFEVERAKVNKILKDKKYQQLMKFGSGKEGASVSFVGTEENIEEFIFYANKKENGFAVVRVIGDLDRGYDYCEKFIQKRVIVPYVDIARLEGKVISYKSLVIEWCQKEKRQFHYDIFEDNGIDGERLFGVKLSIDDKVIAKARATSKKKAEEKASQRAYFAFQEKIDKK